MPSDALSKSIAERIRYASSCRVKVAKSKKIFSPIKSSPLNSKIATSGSLIGHPEGGAPEKKRRRVPLTTHSTRTVSSVWLHCGRSISKSGKAANNPLKSSPTAWPPSITEPNGLNSSETAQMTELY